MNCDDTPYHLEKPVTVTLQNTNHTPERAAKVRELYARTGRSYRKLPALVALIDANPGATVAELLNLLNQ